MSTKLILTNSREKIAHIQSMGSQLLLDISNGISASNPQLVPEFHNNQKSVALKMRLGKTFLNDEYSARFLHVIGEFPKALDYIVHQISNERGNKSIKPKKLYFPCTMSVDEWRKKERDFRHLPQSYRDALLQVQPFKGGWQMANGKNALAVLKWIVNHDKHASPIRYDLNIDHGSAHITLNYRDEIECANAGIPRYKQHEVSLTDGCLFLEIETEGEIQGCNVKNEMKIVPYVNYDGIRYNVDWCIRTAAEIGSHVINLIEAVP